MGTNSFNPFFVIAKLVGDLFICRRESIRGEFKPKDPVGVVVAIVAVIVVIIVVCIEVGVVVVVVVVVIVVVVVVIDEVVLRRDTSGESGAIAGDAGLKERAVDAADIADDADVADIADAAGLTGNREGGRTGVGMNVEPVKTASPSDDGEEG